MSGYLKSILGWMGWSVSSFLEAVGLKSKNANIILVGLDNAGKTTLLHMMTHGSVKSFFPSSKPSMQTKYE
jgi:GTP-binding protein SAR1